MDTTTTTAADLNEEEKEFLIFEAVERVLRAIHDLRQLSSAAAADQQTASSSSSKEEEEHGDVLLIQLAQNLIPDEQIMEALVRMRSSLPDHHPSPNGNTNSTTIINEYVNQFLHLYISLLVKKAITEESVGSLYVEIHNFGTLIRVFRYSSSSSSSSSLRGPELEVTEGFLKKVEITKEEEDNDNEDDDSSSSSSSSSSGGGDHNVCTICLDRMKIGDEVGAFGPCSHIFHLDCVLKWVQKETTCPLCRSPMPSFIMEVIQEDEFD